MKIRSSGFTLIEIVIAISLIGLFVSIPVLSYSGYLKKSRDIKRKNDINQIQAALEQYKAGIGNYPAANELQKLVDSNLLPSVPQDPLQDQQISGTNLVYKYEYTPSADGVSYQLLSHLEGTSAYYQATPIGAAIAQVDPDTGLPIIGSAVPYNTLIPSFSPIPTGTIPPDLTPTPTIVYWKPISITNAPSARSGMAYTWTGSKLFIFGGGGVGSNIFAFNLHDGALYDPVADSWAPISTTEAPANTNAIDYQAVWTGSRVLVWGDRYTPEGGIYDPEADSWVPNGMSTALAPGARYNHTTIWTGSKMIVWGGNDQYNGANNDGGVFDPNNGTQGTWTSMKLSPLEPRTAHTAVWTGTEMIVWGGVYGTFYDNGARYNPTTDTWQLISNLNAPSPRAQHIAVWTGYKMLIWGGRDEYGNTLQNGALYDAYSDRWTPLDTTNAPVEVMSAKVAWTGSQMIVWSGNTSSYEPTNTGGIYNPDIGPTGKWKLIDTAGAPAGRIKHAMVTDGTHFAVWGGLGETGVLGDGGIYTLH